MPYKKVIINGRFFVQRTTGVHRYAREVINELDKLLAPDEWELAVPPDADGIPNYNNIKVVRVGSLKNIMWEHISFPKYVHSRQGVSLNFCGPAPLPSPGIAFIHDVTFKRVPHSFSWKFRMWHNILDYNSTRRAKLLFTVSEFSKCEICECWNITPPPVVIIAYSSAQHYERIDFDESILKEHELTKGNYFFSISSLAYNKNFQWVAQAAANNPGQIFVVAGGMNKRVFGDKSKFTIPDNMKFVGYVTDSQAKTLMRDCKAFLYPSLYEGFGLPPLEAIVSGCRHIVLSDIPVFREIYPRGAYFVDPNDSRSFGIDEIMRQAITDDDREFYMNRYSWKKSAETILHAVNEHVLSAQ